VQFLPTGNGHRRLHSLVAFYAESALEPEYRLLLRPEEVPATRLGPKRGARLGWTSFLTTRKRARPGEVRLHSGVAMLGG